MEGTVCYRKEENVARAHLDKPESWPYGYLLFLYRSTATSTSMSIAIALLLGVKREKAFRFSFLLSIPAITGALGLTLSNQYNELAAVGLSGIEILTGTVAAMLVGYLALKLLWKILAKKKIHVFAFYCWTLGIALMIYSSGIF